VLDVTGAGPRDYQLVRIKAVSEVRRPGQTAGKEDHLVGDAMEFGLIGPLVVRCEGAALAVSRGKERTLLAALLLRANEIVLIDELAEALWGASPPPSAQVTIQNYVKRLRQALGSTGGRRIGTTGGGYLIRVEAGELDVARFEDLASAVRAARHEGRWDLVSRQAQAALSLWRGDPLADAGSRVLAEREVPRLAEMRLQVLEARLDADVRSAGHAVVIPELYRLLQLHPLREHLHATLMLALYRCGRQAEALAVYQKTRDLLVSEIGMEPGPRLQELHKQILAADPALADAGPAQRDGNGSGRVTPRELPSAAPGFAGRSAELEALTRLLDGRGAQAPGVVVVSAIGGMAGAGKTALAVHWAHQVARRFPDGQLFVNLRGFDPAGTPLKAGAVVRRFLEALAVPSASIPSGLDAQVCLYRSLLAGKRMLIVLDNARDSSQVRPLLPGAGGSVVVVTSRNRLTDLVAVDGAIPVPVGPLTRAEARELLARRLGADRIAATPAAVDELIEWCAGLPLALNIASARPAASLEALLGGLRDERRRLDMLSAGPGAGDIRAVLSWSFHALTRPAARLLCLLSLHPGPDISQPATAALAALSADEAQDTLQELLDAHLLTEDAHHRYSMHDLLRAYAAEQADRHLGDAEQDQATGRMFDHYLHTAHTAARVVNATFIPLPLPAPRDTVSAEQFAGRLQARAWCQDERSVLAAITARAARDGHDAHAWQLACSTAAALESTGHWQQDLALLQVGLRAAEHARDPGGQAHAHRHLGRALMMGGRADAALARLQRALALFGQLGDVLNQAETHRSLGVALDRLGQPARSLSHDQHALHLFQEAGHTTGQALALAGICENQAFLGQHEQALTAADHVLQLVREIGHPMWQAAVLDTIGYIHHQLGDHATALRHYQQALQHHDNGGGHPRLHVEVLTHLSDTYDATGDHSAAETARRQAAAILDELQNPTPNTASDPCA
jgi:DNA-binding SARP family transcriptional activator/tetratricopeptide (TPR) repeat protein